MPPRAKRTYTRHIPPAVTAPAVAATANAAPVGTAQPTPPAPDPIGRTTAMPSPATPGVVSNGQHGVNGLPRKADGSVDYDAIDFGKKRPATQTEEAQDIRADLVSQVAALIAQGQQANPALDRLNPENLDQQIRMARVRRGTEVAVLFLRMVMATVDPLERKRIIPITLETLLGLTVGSGGLGREEELKVIISQIRANSPELGQG